MVIPRDIDNPRADREDDLDVPEEWLEVAEDEQIAEGDISVSETVDGHDPTPDLDDEYDTALNPTMHEDDLE
ncbi:MAG: hypothetical protein IT319_05560 [Anaerolineae bacterium]|nr:hypothetical protein [Anaerolineae bacterium]